MGRPSKCEATLPAILERLRTGESLFAICLDKGMPNPSTVYDWIAANDEVSRQISRAREIGWQTRAERAVEDAKVADDASKGRLAFDAERWYLGKMLPRVFGDKTLLGSDPENPLPDSFAVKLIPSSKEAEQ